MDVAGRGKQLGVKVGNIHYDELPKEVLMMVLEAEDVKKVINTIMDVNESGNPGDGKIFVLPIEDAYRVRTGESGKLAI
ncbi:MAG: P-II family nitrogen regulator [Halanaerobium sp.]